MKDTHYICITKTLSIFNQYLKIIIKNGYESSEFTNNELKKILENGFEDNYLYSIILNKKKYWFYKNYDYDSYKKIIDENNEETQEFIIIDGFKEFIKLTMGGINYNEPRKLVYENKILKFNQYINV